LSWEPPTDLGRSTLVNFQDTLAMPDHGVTSRPEILPPGTVFRDIDAPWCPEMVVIPPGQFIMGSSEAGVAPIKPDTWRWMIGLG
jgi:hypothetical protein